MTLMMDKALVILKIYAELEKGIVLQMLTVKEILSVSKEPMEK